jgi:hypothetical protein
VAKFSYYRDTASAGQYRPPLRGVDNRYYASAPVDNHFECHELRSVGFRRWPIRLHHLAMHRPASDAAINSVTAALEAEADLNGAAQPVFVRVCGDHRDGEGDRPAVWIRQVVVAARRLYYGECI